MEHDQNAHEMSVWWRLSDAELALLETKPPQTRLGFTAQFIMYRQTGRFVERVDAFPSGIIDQLAALTETAPADLDDYLWAGRTGRRHRADILRFLGIRRSRREDLEHASAFVVAELCPQGLSPAAMADVLAGWFLERRVACLEPAQLGGLVTTARRRFEERMLDTVVSILSPAQTKMLDVSLSDEDVVTGFTGLKADPGDANLDNILLAAQRLSFVRSLDLPDTLLTDMGEPVARPFRRRAANETPWRMRQHPEGRRHALYAIFLAHRKREITDGLVDLLVDIVHKIRSQAKHTTVKRLSQEIERIHGKETLLVRIAEAATGNPDGTVREVVFPAVGEDVLSAVIREHKASGSFERRVHTVLRASYAGHYRRMLPPVLNALVFQSNNAVHRPVLDAIDWIKRLHAEGRRVVHVEDGIPIDGVIPAKWRDLVLEKTTSGGQRVNCINYEIFTLAALRDRLRE